jgi:arylsulfatase A-like enzyme
MSLLVALLPLLAASPLIAADVPKRPNILVLSTEDMSPWLGCYGDDTVPTPNIDKLASQGIRYTNAFVTTPVCAPSRHTMITGVYAVSDGAMHMRNHSPSREALAADSHAYDTIPSYEAVPPPEVRCFTEFLRSQGYYCTNNVKQDYQFEAPPTAWDASSGRAHWKNRGKDQPFFATFNCTFTHEGQAFPRAEIRSDVAKPENMKVPPYYPDTPAVRKALAQTYNNIHAMDKWVGERLKELEDEGVAGSTIVIFFSDHGVGLPRGKRNCYDLGMRVPLIVKFPDGRRAGTTDERLLSFIEYAPTILSLVGIKPPEYMKGTPFLGEFAGEAPKYVFASSDRMDANVETMRAVSDGRFKYIRNYHPELPVLIKSAYRDRLPMMKDLYAIRENGKGTPEQLQLVATTKPKEELYDTQSDPMEFKNLADDPAQKAKLDELRSAMDAWIKETGDLGFIQPETRLVKEKIWPPDGVQPVTASPVGKLEQRDGKTMLTIDCATEGASIGYRQPGERAWRVYTKSVEVPAGDYELVAHRIGFKPSEIVPVKSQQ